MSYYSETDGQIIDEAKAVLDLLNHATKDNYSMLQVLPHPI